MTMLVVDEVHSGYGKVPVLHGASIRVAEGEIVAVVGPNGAGKSTLVKTIMRMLDATAGTISFDGVRIERSAPNRLTGMGMSVVPQGRNTFPDLSIEDNLRVAGRPGSRRVAAQRMREMFERFPVLGERRGQKAKLLSGGERQMLALASAMMDEPRLLILDEPTTGLAPSIVRQLIDQIVAMRQAGRTILWIVEESPLLVLPYVDRVYLLKSGVIEREMPASTVVNSEELHRIFFGVAEPSMTWTEAPR